MTISQIKTSGKVAPARRVSAPMLRCPKCDLLNETWRILCFDCLEPLNPADKELV